MNRLAIVLLALLLLLAAPAAHADCAIGVFADSAGHWTVYWPTQFVPFDIYVLLWDEAAVEGAAYQLLTPPELVISGSWFSPDENGFELQTPNGSLIGFGECVLGFGGQVIQVARYQVLWTSPTGLPASVDVVANVDEAPTVVYASCSETVEPCLNTQALLLSYGAPVESKSFGAVKSLF